MTDGAAGLLGWLTGHGDDLHELLRAEGGGLATAGGIIEGLFDQAEQQRVGSAVLFGLLQTRDGFQPAVTPEANGDPVEAQLSCNGIQTRLVRQSEKDGDAADQALGSGLTVTELPEQGPLSLREVKRSRRRAAHDGSRWSKPG